MKRIFKSYLIKLLSGVNAFPTSATDQNKLQSLLHKLYPIACNKNLIRLGPKGDGGYLVPDDLVGIEACFSPGVGLISGFEKDCAELGMKVFLADKSIDKPADQHELMYFTKKFVGTTSNNDFMTLDSWVASSLPTKNSDLLLQIDIEGYEYEVFLSVSDVLMRRFRAIIAEFHKLDQLFSMPFYTLAGRVFDKILQTHSCVHIHPNNCCGSLQKNKITIPRTMEFTFLRNDRIERTSYQQVFPNPLDCDNTPNPTLTLPKCWYSQK